MPQPLPLCSALGLRRLLFLVLWALLCAPVWAPPAQAQPLIRPSGAVVSTEQVRAELMAYAPQGIAPGQPLWLGLQLRHQPGWHTYWKNSGDSGLPTQLNWTLPGGVQAGEIAWPVPQRLAVGSLLVNYGYDGTVLLPVPLQLSPGFQSASGQMTVRLQASWLVCRQECIPQEGDFTLTLPLHSAWAMHRAEFQAALAAQPQPLATGDSQVRVQGQQLQLRVVGLPAELQGRTLQAFPEQAEVIQPASPWQQAWQGAVWTATLPLNDQRSSQPAAMDWVLTQGAQGWRVRLPVLGDWPPPAAAATVSPALQAALDANARLPGTPSPTSPTPASLATLAVALLGAFLGGLVLNLMPCVFPVLAIKVLSFARHADDHRAHRLSGLAYTAGVVLSFLGLGLLLLGLRAAGDSLGWGFQLQNPAFVAALAALFTLIGLNLAGVFEFGQFTPSGLAAFQARHPVVDAGLTGVLAVAVASPCTAPFMGASLGLAITLPAWQAMGVFAALGLGLALPYLLASWVPAVARALPRPGAWMDTLRRLLAFPMFGTVAWLVWVLGHQNGVDGAGALLALLVMLSALVWSVGLSGRLRAVIASALLLLGAWLAWSLGPLVWQAPEPATAESSAATPAPGVRWQAWRTGRVEEALAARQAVFVDFTAAWCVTCQYNKKTTLADAQVLADLDRLGVLTLRADWTRRDPAITAALAALGRSGVPVYVLYVPGQPPRVLSEVLSVAELRAALATVPPRP